jgi:molybdopterin-containing oxidoreductase family membrane subunit
MYRPTLWDWGLFLGTIGLFIFLMTVFIRFLPMISLFEIRELLHRKQGKS